MGVWLSILIGQWKAFLVTVVLVGAGTGTAIVVADVTGVSDSSVVTFSHEDDEPLSEEEAAALLARFAEACGSEATPPDLTGLTEDQAEELVEDLIEACDEPLSEEEAAALLARFAEACGSEATPPDLTGLTEDQAEELVEDLIEACDEDEEDEDDDDEDEEDEDDDDEDEEDEDDEEDDEDEEDDD